MNDISTNDRTNANTCQFNQTFMFFLSTAASWRTVTQLASNFEQQTSVCCSKLEAMGTWDQSGIPLLLLHPNRWCICSSTLKTRKSTNCWSSAKPDGTHRTATVVYNTCFNRFRKRSCMTVHRLAWASGQQQQYGISHLCNA